MCGIAGIYIKNLEHPDLPGPRQIEHFTNMLLKGIEKRGHDATGVVSIPDGAREAILEKSDMSASRFVMWRRPLAEKARTIMLHTRFATKGRPENLSNDHPVTYGSCFATHNGHILNDDELFAKHSFERIAQVDTEIIPALFNKYGIDKAHLALQQLDGNFAIAVADPARFPNVLVLAKGPSSPLEYIESDMAIVWASTRGAIEDAWKEVWGRKPEYKDFKSLKYGELLLIENEATEAFDFEVYKRPYVQGPMNQQHSHGGGKGRGRDSRDYRDDWKDDAYTPSTLSYTEKQTMCECGSIRFMHAGRYCFGKCLTSGCTCQSFKARIGDPEDRDEHSFVSRNDAVKSADDSPTKELTLIVGGQEVVFVTCCSCNHAVRQTEAIYFGDYPVCRYCEGEEDEEEASVNPATVIEEDDDDDDEPDDATIAAANELSLQPEYVHWLLFEAVDEDFDNDSNLINAYCVCDDTRNMHVEKINKAFEKREKEIREAVHGSEDDECGVKHVAD